MSTAAINLLEYSQLMYEHRSGDYRIRIYPNPALTEISEPIAKDEFGEDIFKLGAQMVQMMKQANGRGLAGPQVGLLRRICVIDHLIHGPVIICNPVLRLSAEMDCREEACLSIPGMRGKVIRSTEIYMEFRTPQGAMEGISLLGMNARTVQHLVDHLDGVLLLEGKPCNLTNQVQLSRETNLSGS